MHKIFYRERCLLICSGDDIRNKADSGTTVNGVDEAVDFLKGARPDSPATVCLPADNEKSAYSLVCSHFREVEAAGGLVTDSQGRCLMTFRNGVWDLPKGHREQGEKMGETALREVREETGLEKLELSDLICITDHCYRQDGVWELKHTWWYGMRCTEPAALVPQQEEGITEAQWISEEDVPSRLENTYPSIIEVFRETF